MKEFPLPRILSAYLLCFLLWLPSGAYAQSFSFPVPGFPVPGLKAASAASPPPAASATKGTAPASPAAVDGTPTASAVSTTPVPAAHAPVLFNNKALFQVYGDNASNIQDRAALVSLRLSVALHDIPNNTIAKLPRVTVGTEKSASAGATDTVLRLNGQPLLTVTQYDTANYGQSAASLANVWAADINAAYAQALDEQTPAYLRHAVIWAGVIVLAGAILQTLILFLASKMHGSPGWPVQVLLWTIVVRGVLYLFPQTRPVDAFLIYGPAKPVTILIDVGLLAAVLARLWGAVLHRLFPPVPEHLSQEEWGRRSILRRATLASISRVTGVALIWFVGFVTALSWAGVNLSALLTSAGLIGVGIGLATQDMMKDLVAGVNILADDRFGVGDTIQMGEYEGRVEKLDLRITQIRDLSGRLITIPNRNIAQVANLTSRWAQVDLRIGVSYYDDLRQAMELMTDAAMQMKQEQPNLILADPHMLGVDSFNDSNITLRMLLRTLPGEQWHIARDLRARIKAAFDANRITLTNALHAALPPEEPKEPELAPASPEPSRNGDKDGAKAEVASSEEHPQEPSESTPDMNEAK